MFGKILCPVDFSPPSQAALRVAARLAAQSGSELVLAHAWHFPVVAAGANDSPLPGTTLQLVMQDEKRSLGEAVDFARALGAPRIDSVFRDGSPWHSLVEIAGEQGCDLIVMGTHGRTGLKRVLIGSVAEKVVRHAPCSVLVVRGNPDGPQFEHVLCPIDFADDSSRIIERAEDLVRPGGQVDLLHVIQLPLAASGDPLLVDFITDVDRRATLQLERLADAARDRRRTDVRSEALAGHPAEMALAKLEEDRSYDLVAVGTHGRTGIKRVLLGSIAENLVRHAPCSVLVVRGRT